MNQCPSCQQSALSWWRKLCLGPLNQATCRQCGQRVSISWWSLWLHSLIHFVLFLGRLAGTNAVMWLAIGTVIVICLFVEYRFIPLIPKR